MGRPSYTELANAQVSDSRTAVISKGEQGYTIAQKIVVPEGPRMLNVFMKGAIHVDNLEGIQRLRDALNLVLQSESRK